MKANPIGAIIAVITAAVAALISMAASAQSEKYEQRYNLLVSKLGPDGVGVETVLKSWEQADSTDSKMLLAKFNYYFTKSQSSQVVAKPSRKFLGMEPVLTLKDSTGTDIYYYQEPFYDDELYGQAMKAVDKAIRLYPEKLDFRFLKANAYIAYEKESPDMALAFLEALVNESMTRKVWLYNEQPSDATFFSEAMLDYCFSFYTIGSPAAMKAFLALSERMNQLDPRNPGFINNIGSYHLVVNEDYKTALKYYNKALKLQPDDYTAIKNCVTIARRQKNVKMEKKYLQMLVQHGSDSDKLAAQARLQQIGK
jgi:tetratricopeptide (TPR) repeat protein